MSYALVVTTIGPCNKPISDTFGINERAMGLLISAHYAGFIITTIYAGYLVEKIGLKPVMVGSIFLLGITLIGFGMSWSAPVLFIMMFFTGVGGGAVESAINALISSVHSETRVYSLNMLHMFFGVGAFIWPVIAGSILKNGTSWQTLYIIIGIFSLFMGLVMFIQKFPEVTFGEKVSFRDTLSMMRIPSVVVIGGVVALYVGGEIGINAWIVRYFDREVLNGVPFSHTLKFGVGAHVLAFTLTSGIFQSLYWFTMTVGRFFVTFTAKSVPDYLLLRVLTLGSAICAIATFIVRDAVSASIFLGLTGFFFSGIFATAIATGGNRFPDKLGQISGIIICFSGIGNVVLNAAIGEVAQRAGNIRAGMLFASAILVGMTICAFAVKKQPKVSGAS